MHGAIPRKLRHILWLGINYVALALALSLGVLGWLLWQRPPGGTNWDGGDWLFTVFAICLGTEIALITTLINLLKRLQNKTHKLALLAKHTATEVVITDTRGRVEWVNPSFINSSIAREVDPVGQSLLDLMRDSGMEASVRSLVESCIETRDGLRTRYKQTLPMGQERWFMLEMYPVAEPGESPTNFIFAQRDVTNHHIAALQLEASENRYRRLVESSPDAVIVHQEGNIVFCNPAAADLLGAAAPAELLGLSILDIVPEDQRETAAQKIVRIEKADSALLFDSETILRRDGEIREVQVRAVTTLYNGKPAVQATLRDITQQRRLAQMQHQAQKLESIGRLAAGIAHEINTPIQFIGDNTNFVKMAFQSLDEVLTVYDRLLAKAREGVLEEPLFEELDRGLKKADINYLREEVPAALKQSLEGVERVTHIVRAMKEFSHPGGAERQPTDINRAIESTVIVSRNEWKYVAEVKLDLSPKLPLVPLLPDEFNQVMLNLVVNAAQAIGESLKDGDRGEIRISTRLEGEWVEIVVEDNGPGIPPEIKSRIFDPFFTTKEVGKGTGQGLAIAHSVIADKHKGTIHVESQQGHGARFIIRIPAE